MIFEDLTPRVGETEDGFIWRIGKERESGLVDISWADIAEIINLHFREPGEYIVGKTCSNTYGTIKRVYEEVFSKSIPSEVQAKIREERQELEKEKVKLRDEKNDYRRIIREQARKESLEDFLGEAAKKLNEKLPLVSVSIEYPFINDEREAVACLSDWHYGLISDNIWNQYNPEICIQRVNKCVSYMKKYLRINNIDTLHIVLLGDFAHGAIYNCRLYSREDVCDQLMQVSEILAQAINELSHEVNNVTVYSCYGNHMRTTQKKEDSKSSDNMEKIIPWWLEQRLSSNQKVTISYSQFKEFTLLSVVGNNIVCVHGNDFNFKDIGITTHALFTKMFGVNIDYTISGDKHHLEEFEKFGIESILIRSLCGTDDYANNLHLYGKAGQTLMIFNSEYGRECTYHIPLY